MTAPQETQASPPASETAALNVNGVRVIALGTLAWLIALIVVLVVDRHSWWVWVCITGFGLGMIGIPNQARYQRRYK